MSSYLDEVLRQHVRVQGQSQFVAREVGRLMRNLQKDVDMRVLLKMGGMRTVEVQRMLADLVKDGYGAARDRLYDEGRAVVETTAVVENRFLQVYTETLTTNLPDPAQLFAAIVDLPYQGSPFADWLHGQESKLANALQRQVGLGFLQNETVDQIRERISPIFNKNRVQTEAIARSFTQHMANTARLSVLEQNQDLIQGYVWISTLDHRTTMTCAARDGLKYDKEYRPVGHNVPWGTGPGQIHWNCRSTAVAWLEGQDDPRPDRRPAVSPTEDYKGLRTRNGKVRRARRGSGLEGDTVGGRTDYSSWLARQPAEFQRDVLGNRRYELFRSAKTVAEKRRLVRGFGIDADTPLGYAMNTRSFTSLPAEMAPRSPVLSGVLGSESRTTRRSGALSRTVREEVLDQFRREFGRSPTRAQKRSLFGYMRLHGGRRPANLREFFGW